jgi:uncharacterized protein (DUF1800 family)
MSQLGPDLDHLLRRAGFGASAADVEVFRDMSPAQAVAHLVDYAGRPDDVDERIGRPDHAQIATNNLFAPDIDIDDARQRWLFRMIHTRRPLQEKMALFWHNHFATAYSKLAADSDRKVATKMLAHKPGSLRGPMGQIELFRQYGLGSYRDLLYQVAQDPATLVWLDGQFNTRAKPQENFGREIMELFSVGVGYYTEPDVYAAARVFSGWNLRKSEGYDSDDNNAYKEFVFYADQHETSEKTFSFPIYSSGSRTIPAGGGMQDGLDLINALATHPETARRLARKFWNFFVSEIHPPDPAFISTTANVYLQSGTRIGPVVYSILNSPWFNDPAVHHARFAWPVEYVVRAIKELGWQNFSLDRARAPLASMGQALYEPPNVGGWPLGTGWFSTSTMLARSNFAATLASSQKSFIAADVQPQASSPQALMTALRERVTTAPFDAMPEQALLNYLVAGGAWTGSESQVNTRAAGLARLLVASSEYQLV